MNNEKEFKALKEKIIEDIDSKISVVADYLHTKYGYTEERLPEAINYLLQDKNTAFEFWYYVTYGKFVPDEYATSYSGYTAKRISEESYMTEMGAFNYMVYMMKKPEEAVENFKRGLPLKSANNSDELGDEEI